MGCQSLGIWCQLSSFSSSACNAAYTSRTGQCHCCSQPTISERMQLPNRKQAVLTSRVEEAGATGAEQTVDMSDSNMARRPCSHFVSCCLS